MSQHFKWLYIAYVVSFVVLIVAFEFIGFVIFLGLVVCSLLIYLNYKVAKKFEQIAFSKGQTKAVHAFEMCFWLGIVGYLYVIALPNANFDIKRLNQQKRIIELLQTMNERTESSPKIDILDEEPND